MGFRVKKDPTKVLILATGEGWQFAPKLSHHTIYALNDYVKVENYKIIPDILFIMDILDEKPQVISGHDNLGAIVERINQMRVPLIAPYKYEEIPLSVPFPLELCVKRFGLPYFTNTICYMIAFALLQGAKEIGIYGVNQAGSHEYSEERGGVEYWIGVANGLGVKITINGDKSNLLRYKGRYGNGILYGYLQSYEDIMRSIRSLGGIIIKRLSERKKLSPQAIRKVNHES